MYNNHRRPILNQISERWLRPPSISSEHHTPNWNLESQFHPGGASPTIRVTVAPLPGLPHPPVAQRAEGCNPAIRHHDDIATATPIPAIRSTPRHEFLTPK